MTKFVERHISKQILKNFEDIESVFINGARQAGKSTFVKDFSKHFNKHFYFSFDDLITRANEINSPGISFRDITEGLIILDEIQLVPDSFMAIKTKIDDIRKKKQKVKFLMTGSADIMLIPQLSQCNCRASGCSCSGDIMLMPHLAQALTGRMYIKTMYPFSCDEIMKTRGTFIENIFDHPPKTTNKFDNTSVEKMIYKATFPKLSLEIKDKTQWCQNYISTIFERDIKNLSDIDKLEALPQLMSLFANRVGRLLNDTEIANAAKLSLMTARRYRSFLGGIFLISTMQPWLKDIKKRLVKAPKIYFNDTMLLCHILGLDPQEIAEKRPDLYGFILENFAASEIRKQLSLLSDGSIYHFKTQDQKEIDFIVEKRNGDFLAIEVKASHTVFPEDFKNIKFLKKEFPKNFVRGIVLYQGDKTLQFEDDIFAMPIQALWEF
ncbi:MAG: ATP-binding protein [Elusimicrobiota bacterium]|nr:ATP-binding protein [Elusimicrobiota bacterium]